ncbi:hypothetical protein CU254_19260 [Amycolatopsis sp. AA4]|uniref:DUF6461 domain-containing protein n=1 Tax=Actinomycetes TaxID=1760 RepID=UPI0001B58067|nr:MULTISPECIES: DUF6461 domain-containing protein [Actinomycetes]ATY12367.1 hypothetical protein CU254_19260 [Amycolatopsis sp. AA4]EFL08119.1 hypothetical protein SSMG_03790 [Streptomyces sp. AA4]
MNEKSPVDERYRSDPNWAWLASPTGVVLGGGALTFVRHMSVDDVFRKFDIDPASATTMTAQQALTDPLLQTAGFDIGPQWLRVAESGEWTVAVEYRQQKAHLDGIAGCLAQDTDVVMFAGNEFDPAEVQYLSHGEFVFAFGCGAPYDSRAGTRPQMFDDEMFDAGLIDFPSRAPIGDSVIAMAVILSRHLGFALTPETVTGPLPTAYRMHSYTPPPPGPKTA